MTDKKEKYLDYAAASPVDERVATAMAPFKTGVFGNPSSLHHAGRAAREALDDARDVVARHLSCRASEIVFTSGGTEADNLALFGLAAQYGKTHSHIVGTTIEHHAILNPIEEIVKRGGFSADLAAVERDGIVLVSEVIKKVNEKTLLVTVMFANNEIGTIQPIAEIGAALAEWKKANGRKPYDPPFFHTDACQAAAAFKLDVKELGVDLLTINGSKICGPKGVGALFVRDGVKIKPLIFGGGQEWRLRSGTENVAAIVGFAKALDLAAAERETENARLSALRDKLFAGLLTISKSFINGHQTKRLPNNVNVTILDIEGEAMILYLDEAGFCVSTGSACTSANLEPSHVIRALGLPYEAAHGSLRISMGRFTEETEIDELLRVLPPIVEKLRRLSPVRLDMKHYT
jgi:cysteine desulfurase